MGGDATIEGWGLVLRDGAGYAVEGWDGVYKEQEFGYGCVLNTTVK